MLGDNIRKYRREKGESQESLAAALHVVRQTLSKWEKGRSVPDAEQLVRLSEVLGVSVSTLLDIEEAPAAELTAELERLNEMLAERDRQLHRNALAGRKRGAIIFLSFVALFVSAVVRNVLLSLAAVGLCLAAALCILYRNLALLSERPLSAGQTRALNVCTIFSAVLLAGLIALAGLMQAGVITRTERQESRLLVGIFACVFLFFGAVSPRLPFQRHTGLRLPWTVRDEETWTLAHRVLGIISLPVTLLYLAAAAACSDLKGIGTASVIAMGVYIGIPAVISLAFFWKKYHSP